MYYDLALGGQTLERALTLGKIRTLGARFCHLAPNARALSITAYSYDKQKILEFI
jgi:hypothetical protein